MEKTRGARIIRGLWCACFAAAAHAPASSLARLKVEVSAAQALSPSEATSKTTASTLACVSGGCAAFYSDANASCRLRAVRLDATGAPLANRRSDYGATSCSFRVVAAGADFALAFSDPQAPSGLRVLLLD